MTTPVPAPFTTTIQVLRNGICEWFGGSYDPASRSYRTPQVEGLGVVRRGRPKADDDKDYYLGSPSPGAVMGSQMLVHVGRGKETRAAVAGPFNGLKLLRSDVTLHLFMRSNTQFSEDAQDAFYDFLEVLKARIRADRCLGTGGFEVGGFQVGEGGTELTWAMELAETSAEMTSGYLTIQFTADYYLQG